MMLREVDRVTTTRFGRRRYPVTWGRRRPPILVMTLTEGTLVLRLATVAFGTIRFERQRLVSLVLVAADLVRLWRVPGSKRLPTAA